MNGVPLADQAVALGLPVFPCNSHKRPLDPVSPGWNRIVISGAAS